MALVVEFCRFDRDDHFLTRLDKISIASQAHKSGLGTGMDRDVTGFAYPDVFTSVVPVTQISSKACQANTTGRMRGKLFRL